MSEENDIVEFRTAFGLPINSNPALLSKKDTNLHLSLIMEEYAELEHALYEKNLVEIFDALVDLKYVITGMGVHMGLPMDEGWKEVHSSNMSKLDENGEPMYHDGTEGPEGKVKKSPLYREPRLDVILEAKET